MTEYDAYGTVLKTGTNQVETAVVVITTITAGNSNWVLTASGMTGTPITTVVALANNDTASEVATKAAAGIAVPCPYGWSYRARQSSKARTVSALP